MRFSYKKKLFLYFFIVFFVFTVIIMFAQRSREKEYKTESLKNSLNSYAEIVNEFIRIQRIESVDTFDSLRCILPLLPDNLRLTVVDERGNVLYENSVDSGVEMENHMDRPEINTARVHGSGSAIRPSQTTGKDYYYYTRYYAPYFIRVALPYNITLQDYLRGDNIFIYFILLLFFTVLLLLLYLSDKFGKAVTGLNEFISTAPENQTTYKKIKFPDTELGEIGNKIIAGYALLEESKNKLKQEQEKLIRHFHYSEEGICIFSPEFKKIYANTHFIQHINIILDEPLFDPEKIFIQPEFVNLKAFLNANIPVTTPAGTIPVYQEKINKNGKHFLVKLVVFNDNSFEVNLNNISVNEEEKLLKQEMTNNIAHELKTPVSSIRGYIETLLEQSHIEPEKQHFFLERAYAQTLRLSDLIRDIALITKTEEAADLFEKEQVNIHSVIDEVTEELQSDITENHIQIENRIKEDVSVKGNHTLIYSVFRNLIENAICYGGEDAEVVIDNYMEDADYYYFSLYDNGPGVAEEFLERIFDRFYRINEGRSRKSGGSGLGLSIVKNAILFHNGRISAKNRKEGGLEFLFTLKKDFNL